jgi:hypothetical protein
VRTAAAAWSGPRSIWGDAVLMKVHHSRHGRLQFGELGDGEVAQNTEYCRRSPWSSIGADPPQPLRIGDVIGHQVPAAGHCVTS